jgi:hypothetical protein
LASYLLGLCAEEVSPPEDFVKKALQSLSFLTALAVALGLSLAASAQTTPQARPDAQAQQAPPTPSQPPDQAAPPATNSTTAPEASSGSQAFTGTVVKSGDKYMFQEEGTNKTYDIDHQEEVQKFEGKRVKVHGVIDPDGKTIRLQ